jgi:thiol:disulfide interchange protein
MPVLPQFLNRYVLLLLPAVLLGAWVVLLVLKRYSWKAWSAWAASCAALLLGLLLLRTPGVTVIAARPEALQDAGAASHTIPEFSSPEEIRRVLESSHGRPTLVDFYTDYGMG